MDEILCIPIEAALVDSDAQILGMVHSGVRLTAPNPQRMVWTGDILIIEAEAEALAGVLSTLQLKLEEEVESPEKDESADAVTVEGAKEMPQGQALAETENANTDRDKDKTVSLGDIALMELVVLPGSPLAGRSASGILLRARYSLNLLALSCQGQHSIRRLRSVVLRSGDLLLMQGLPEAILEFAADNGCVRLAERELHIPNRRRAWEAGIIMILAIVGAAFGLLPAATLPLPVVCWLRWRCAPCRRAWCTKPSTGR